MPIKPVMVRSLSRRADDWQAWQAGWVVHAVALINCQRLGYTWADGANMEVDGEQSHFFVKQRVRNWGRLKLCCSPTEWSGCFCFFSFCSMRLIPEAQFVAFCRAVCLSVEQNVQHLSEGKLKVSFTLPGKVSLTNTHQRIWTGGPLQRSVSHGLQPDLSTKSQH